MIRRLDEGQFTNTWVFFTVYFLLVQRKKIKSVIDYGDILYMHANVSFKMLDSADHGL